MVLDWKGHQFNLNWYMFIIILLMCSLSSCIYLKMDLSKLENMKAELKAVELARDRSNRELQRLQTRLKKLEAQKTESTTQVDIYNSCSACSYTMGTDGT